MNISKDRHALRPHTLWLLPYIPIVQLYGGAMGAAVGTRLDLVTAKRAPHPTQDGAARLSRVQEHEELRTSFSIATQIPCKSCVVQV